MGTFGMRGSEAGRVGRSRLGFPLVGWEYTEDKMQGVRKPQGVRASGPSQERTGE